MLHAFTRKWKLYVVTGAPGCGETSFVWMCEIRLMQQQGGRVLFIQYRKQKECDIWIWNITKGDVLTMKALIWKQLIWSGR